MDKFILHSNYKPTGDQPEAIRKLTEGVLRGDKEQTLLGVTGSGKTFTMANIIEKVNRPTLVLAHNKTLAAQLCSEFREFFPENAVEYFVSYYDYYQPEAYIPGTDTYIEKDSAINDEIDKLRHSATCALSERRDVIIVASVSCIYSLGNPIDYRNMILSLRVGMEKSREDIIARLVDLQYERNDINFVRNKFRVRGDVIEIFPAYSGDTAVRIELFGDEIDSICEINVLTGEIKGRLKHIGIYPASHYIVPADKMEIALKELEREMEERVEYFTENSQLIEAQRIRQRTEYDIDMLREIGMCKGIENYSRVLSGRPKGSTPFTLLDYFPDDFLLFVDESHVTLPQVRGMHGGDFARKKNLVDYGFRLPSAYDNRPLDFKEFYSHINQAVFVSATPGELEKDVSSQVVEQVIRPTGLLDPLITVKSTDGQIDDIVSQINIRTERGERVLITTLTKKMAEDLTEYLEGLGIKVRYMHYDIDTIERMEIIRDLRLGEFDVLVGINLLREGLDIPEVSLVCILDADKEGFLRSETSLIQTVGRAARNSGGEVIMYADSLTPSMERAITETERRRAIQQRYNEEHGIVPTTIKKDVREILDMSVKDEKDKPIKQMSRQEKQMLIARLTAEMREAAKMLEFEHAAKLRDRANNLKNINLEIPRDSLVVFTGLSGSGKSSLAFDTLYAEGQRRYVESLSSYARQFLGQMEKPDVDSIDGLSPAISIDQKTTSKNPRSTVGTVTEIYDYLRLLYARVGIPHCPVCHKEITQQTTDQIVDKILELDIGTKIQILSPKVLGKKGEHTKIFESARKSGFVRVRVDGIVYDLSENFKLEKTKKHNVEIVVDRLVIKEDIRSRLTDSVETALNISGGLLAVDTGEDELRFSQNYACEEHGISVPELTPTMFSFNSPFGACPTCMGLGMFMKVEPRLVIPDESLSLAEGAIKAPGWNMAAGWGFAAQPPSIAKMYFTGLAEKYGFELSTPYSNLSASAKQAILYGTDGEELNLKRSTEWGGGKYRAAFEGVVNNMERRYKETTSDYARREIEQFMYECPCPDCKGARLKDEYLEVTVGDKSIKELCDMSVVDEDAFLKNLSLSSKHQMIAKPIIKEIAARLEFLKSVGLDYLCLSRSSGTLSGGESQRIRLATQIGSALTGVLYILDEPSIGLHQRDNERLINTMKNLRDIGNTLIVVEHDDDTVRAADFVVDIGPGAGIHGGEVVCAGSVQDIMNCKESITGDYLLGRRKIPVPSSRREGNGKFLEIRGAAENNLKNINVKIPLGKFVAVTGVSGSGKSSLVNDIISKALSKELNGAHTFAGKHKEIRGLDNLDKVINIDQSPIGRTPRSNPATYTGVFSDI